MENELNPWVFMLINMFIVFFVLIMLWVLMTIIRLVDPTGKKKSSPKPVAKAAPAAAAAAAPAATSTASGNDEVVAAITAAIVAMGYSSTQIASIRPAKNTGWTAAARLSGVDNY
ncbi:MAG: OadG family protein [Negativicoccus succinicivorans]|uniref:OadG family protein n=1 Tax=Negativicoccus succinicivorans TaxID=620903 RepID=UPI00290A2E32|nr:OadG family protein [Negativicoccus succinicivorans]MDU5914906.1 OadG family protein [Negativicoccus succinicivorans]